MLKQWLFADARCNPGNGLGVLLLAVGAVLLLPMISVRANDDLIHHRFLNAFPAIDVAQDGPAIVLDGDVDDWHPDAFVLMYGDRALREFYNVRMALAYDDTGLWIAARFVDSSPMLNQVDPALDSFRGWDGDALQVRLISDASLDHPVPDDLLNTPVIKHLTFWYFTEGQFSVLDVRHGMKFADPQTYSNAHDWVRYRRHDDGEGYDLEAHLPWSMLSVSAPPQPNDRWLLTVQPLWGNEAGNKVQHKFFDVIQEIGFHFQRPDGWGHVRFVVREDVADVLAEQVQREAQLEAPRRTDAEAVPHLAIEYDNPAAGYVSMAVCDAEGRIVRTLLAREHRDAGHNIERWDGLDDDSRPAPVGTYQVKALVHDGIKPRFVASVHNSGNPPWVTSDGKGQWGADHTNPIAAAAGDDGWSFIAWSMNEKGSFLQGVDADGQKHWGADLPVGDFSRSVSAIGYHDGVVYVGQNGPGPKGGGLLAFDAATGRRLAFADGKGTLPITQWTQQQRIDHYEQHGTPIYPFKHPRTGGPEYYGTANLGLNITGIAADDRRLYVSLLYDNRIVVVNLDTAKVESHWQVELPGGLAFDAQSRRLFAVSGEQVVAIDTMQPDATPQVVIADGLSHPVGLALDGQGRLYVSVQGKQMQVRVFDLQGTRLHTIGKEGGRPFVGRFDKRGMLLPAGICVTTDGRLWVTENDATPRRVSVWDADSGAFIREYFGGASYAPMMAPDPDQPEHVYIHDSRFIIDYETGQVTPDATVYRRTLLPGPSIPGSNQGYGFMGSTFQVSRYGGRTFAFNGYGGIFAVHDDHFTPLMYIGGPRDRRVEVFDVLDVAKRRGDTGVVWIDADADAIVDADEVTLLENTPLRNHIRSFGGTFHPKATFISGGRIFRPQGLTDDGRPIYPHPAEAPLILTGDGQMNNVPVWQDVWPSYKHDWNDWYAIAAVAKRIQGRHVREREGVYRFNRAGDIKWTYRRVSVHFGLSSPLSRVGDIYGALRIAGLIEQPADKGGEIIGIGSYRGYFSFLNEDGLFIDQVGHDTGRGPKPDFDTFFIENFSGYFFRHKHTGKVYLFAGDTDARVLELQGWDSIRTFTGPTVELDAALHRDVLATLAGEATEDNTLTTLPVTAAPAEFNGSLDSLPASNVGTIALVDDNSARVALAYDRRHLHVIADVHDSSPALNSAKDWRYAFKGGDAVDVQLGIVNPAPPRKRQAQPGDVRVFIVPGGDNGGVQFVAMWPRVEQGMEAEPITYESPTGQETFERVELLRQGKATIERHSDGYTLHARIPWAALNMTAPSPHTVLQGDVGILLSDADGSMTTLRRYLFNKDTGIVMDVPSEVRVQSDQWGMLRFE